MIIMLQNLRIIDRTVYVGNIIEQNIVNLIIERKMSKDFYFNVV